MKRASKLAERDQQERFLNHPDNSRIIVKVYDPWRSQELVVSVSGELKYLKNKLRDCA